MSLVSTSFLERHIKSFSLSKRGREPSEQIRGPLGLNLLWEPSEPQIDFIFVHGLRGGSRKTWSISNDPAHYWPKEWLPLEPQFKNVRIHSYGYNADWGERKGSVLTIHDFGQALLGDIQNCLHIQKDNNAPIVLIGHSMGGLVIKKAYILAKRDPAYHELGCRFHTLFFLATPHRGADSAQLLTNILRVSMSHESKAYVHDLIPSSGAIESINDDFRHVYQGSYVWSFFEAVKTNLGFNEELIVEKDSAVIGLPHERIQLLNADHRHVCKFANRFDNNYVTLRNAFISTIDAIEKQYLNVKHDEFQCQMKFLSQFLGISERPEGDLSRVSDRQLDGTCQWLVNRSNYCLWQEGGADRPRIFWLRGQPATGKSTAAGHVIKHLMNRKAECSYYFFQRSDNGASTAPHLLRSLAFQRAYKDTRVRQSLLKMQYDGETLSKDDDRNIWRTVFAARILRIDLPQPHFWIIDGLDECRNNSNLFSMLAKIDPSFKLQIFITSRPTPAIERHFAQEKIAVCEENMTVDDSVKDIRFFLESNSSHLPVDDDSACAELIDTIVERSNGCFLWAALVLKELEATHSEEQIREVLKDVPTEMDDLYNRILQSMNTLSRDKEIATAIFRWTVCAARPLSTEELKAALKFDINKTLPRLEKSIGSICGNLIYVDHQSRVRLVHQTVKTFLTRENLDSHFAIDRIKANSRLAQICLQYLVGDEMKRPRNQRRSGGRILDKRSIFAEYAKMNFAGHIARSSSSTDSHFLLLECFLKTNVLSWIESIAQSGNLYPLTQAARFLKIFLERGAKYRSPLGDTVYIVNTWVNDLLHLVPAFGKSLVASPSSVYSLVPAVCPPTSMLHQLFGRIQPCLKVVGTIDGEWDDRLSCIAYPGERATAVATQDSRMAVSLSGGFIYIYNNTTLQETMRLHHAESVRQLRFANVNPLLASSGRRTVKLWNAIEGFQLWSVDHGSNILTLSFSQDDVLLQGAMRSNQLVFWNIAEGIQINTCPLHQTLEDDQSDYRPPATHAQFLPEQNLLAIAHRQRPVSFWDLETHSFVGQFYVSGDKSYPGPLVTALCFNPIAEINLLAVSYQEDYLIVVDPWTQQQQAMIKSSAYVLAASPDGRTLAAGDAAGTIRLLEFETLSLLYCVAASDYGVASLAFASNNLRFFDIRYDHCNVWEPSVLVRPLDAGDVQSENVSEETMVDPQLVSSNFWGGDLTITTTIDHPDGDVVFCGREDGSIVVFETSSGKLLQTLCKHTKNIAISHLYWDQNEGVLASTDVSSRFIARKISYDSPGQWIAKPPILDERTPQAIWQVLLGPNGKLLLTTATSDELWDLTTASLIRRLNMLQPTSRVRITHPKEPHYLLFIDAPNAHVFKWDSLEEITSAAGIPLSISTNSEASFTDNITCHTVGAFFITFTASRSTRHPAHLQLWASSSIQQETGTAHSLADYDALASNIRTVISMHKSSLLFLDHDGWVCSVKVEHGKLVSKTSTTLMTKTNGYVRHFFIPYGWYSGHEPVVRCTSKGHVVLARGDGVAVFQRGLAFEEVVEVG